MQKFFVNDNQIIEEKAIITGEDVRHISNVLRMKVGEELQIGNKQKVESYIAEIERIEKDKVIAKLIEKCSINNEPNVDIDLYQGLPKADKMEWIIQKTTEVGVNKIIPVEMTRCIVKLDEKDAIKKITRWQKVAEGAAKQSKRDKIPVIENKIKLEAPYHELTNAGHISYIELDGDPSKNVEAFEKIVRMMKENNMGYAAINHPVDRDPVCGYVGVIGDVCPGCGRRANEAVSVEKLHSLSCDCK